MKKLKEGKVSNMNKFKAGDTVKILRGELQGEIGEVILYYVNAIAFPYIVLFDKDINQINPTGTIRKTIELAGYDYRKCYIFDAHELQLMEGKKTENIKSLLKSGDTVVLRNGDECKVFLDYETKHYGRGIISSVIKNYFNALIEYDRQLIHGISQDLDIVQIYRPRCDSNVMSTDLYDYYLVWKRKEVKEMTMEEICEALGYEVKIKKEDE